MALRRTLLLATLCALARGLSTANRVPRRALLERLGAAAAASSVACALPPSAAAAPPAMDDYTTSRGLDQQPTVGAMTKLASGVRYVDIRAGSGPAVVEGSRVSLQWVLRRSNGYFVDGSVGGVGADADTQFDPFVFVAGDGTALRGLDEALRGARQGGVRRVVIPAADGLGYTLPIERSAGPLPAGFGPRRQLERELSKQDPYNYFFLEVEASRVS